MVDRLDAVSVSRHIADTYHRYLETLLPITDGRIAAAVRAHIAEPGALVKGPILEATPPFENGASLRDLMDEGVLSTWLEQVGHEDGIPLDRPLYRHQEEAIRHIVGGRNAVVATGTGSGKTESFLLPILQHLAGEHQAGTLDQPGVRALLLYPMNALANDQLKRLRGLLAPLPEVTFGRYTGETKRSDRDAIDHHVQRFGEEPLPNELVSRPQMQERPPHLLLTNYAMLEYLLLRPSDQPLFDIGGGTCWQFVVMDEAHVYDGASGIEVAMLLRRLRDRVAMDRDLTCIATSATVGGREAGPAVADFARTLFGAPFAYEDEGGQRDVIWASRRTVGSDETWGPLGPEQYGQLATADDVDAALEAHRASLPRAGDGAAGEILADEHRIKQLRELLATGPTTLERAAQALFPDHDDAEQLTGDVVALGARVRDGHGAPLIAARYHLWARAAEGAFVCMAREQPHVHLTRHEQCATCNGAVFELGACKRCATTYLVGTIETEPQGRVLRPTKANARHRTWVVLGEDGTGTAQRTDEDEAVLEDLEDQPDDYEVHDLCLGCGRLDPGTPCPCGGPLRRVLRAPTTSLRLTSCGMCGGRSNAGQIRQLTSGTDASVSVLSSALYQALPAAAEPTLAEKPGAGRKLLFFADSRQDAAYFAPYLEDSYGDLQRRRIIHRAISDETGSGEVVRLDDVSSQLRRVADSFGVFHWKATRSERQRTSDTWLHAELRSSMSAFMLERLGLVAFELMHRPGLAAPQPLVALGLSASEAWDLVDELLRTMRTQGAVSFAPDVPPDDRVFEPRIGNIYLRKEGSEARRKVMSWLPTRGVNTRLDYLRRVLSEFDAAPKADEVLAGVWTWLSRGPGADLLHGTMDAGRGSVWQLAHDMVTVRTVTPDHVVHRCRRCRRLAPVSIRDICPTMGCDGRLTPWSPPDPDADRNHYRVLARSLNAVPLSVKEHTAQWHSNEAARIQEDFLNGDVNALSCSTTFELGVDVGELQAVVLRNVPPMTSNYVQRAGRAGRRTGSAALVVTYAQARSHDLTYFGRPERMIAGEVRAPRVTLSNGRIAQRHAQAVAVAAWFRHVADTDGTEYRQATDMFGDEAEQHRFEAWLHTVPDDVIAAMRRVIPGDLHEVIGLADGSWVDHLVDRLQAIGARHRNDVAVYRELEDAASRHKRHDQAGLYSRIVQTFKQRYLLQELSSHNVLPKYGFPVDTVELRTSHLRTNDGRRLELTRDLKLAISDYAPGSAVVAGGKVWQSGGLYRLPNRDFPRMHYIACTCGYYQQSHDADTLHLEGGCPSCGSKTSGVDRSRTYVEPEFGFLVDKATVPARPTSRPRRVYSNDVHLISAPGDDQHMDVVDLGETVRLHHRYVERGELVVVNSGSGNRGYRICKWCGAGEPATPGQHARTAHTHPLTGKDCSGTWEWLSLGHSFETDVLQLKFDGIMAPTSADVWWGLLYALVESAADLFEISRDDLDGTIHYGPAGTLPTLVLYDNVPAGAGHVARIHQGLVDVVRAAHDRVSTCECGPETSCYRCLRGYRNQRRHDTLRRGAVADLLAPAVPGRAGGDGDWDPVVVDDLLSHDGRRVKVAVNGAEHVGTLWVEADDASITNVTLQTGDDMLDLDPTEVNLLAVRSHG